MSRISDLIAAAEAARHCTDRQCGKCRARSRWYRRKSRKSGKTLARKTTRRK